MIFDAVWQVVEHSQNRTVAVVLLREGAAINTRITPRTWSGPGLLGFKIRYQDP